MSTLSQLPTQIWYHRIPIQFKLLIEGYIKQNISTNCPLIIIIIILINGFFTAIFRSIADETLENPNNMKYVKELKQVLFIFEQQPRNSWDKVMLKSLGI